MGTEVCALPRMNTLAEVMRSIRIHGQGQDKYENIRIGINGRLDTLQAAILLAKFEIFPEEIELRNQAAKRYTRSRHPSPLNRSPFHPRRDEEHLGPVFCFGQGFIGAAGFDP